MRTGIAVGGGVAITTVSVLLGLWGWVLLSRSPLQNPVATLIPWPIMCSTRGCIATTTWQRYHHAAELFAEVAKTEQPTVSRSLTALARQHLVTQASVKVPASLADAQRYREEILHIYTDEQLQEVTDLTLAEYDRLVVQPFLVQEALRQQRHAESPTDLFQQLANERLVIVPLWHYTWNAEIAEIAPR